MNLLRRFFILNTLLAPALLAAQTGSIQGTVVDSSGAVVQGARITATNQSTNQERTATTSSSGFYSITNLVPALYTLMFEKEGFASVVIKDATLTTSQVFTMNATLKLGSVQETLEVNASAIAPVETESAQLSTLISNKTMTDLPLLTRNPYELILLSPGTNLNLDFTGGISVNGSRDRNNNFLLDGVDNNDTSVPGGPTGILSINPDSAQEFRVITDTFNPEYGRNTGAIIDVVTRSGTNSLHGNAYEFGRYNALGARDFFNAKPDPQNPYVRNQFGFSLGGPILKNRTFFFINGEFQRFRTTLTERSVLPTAEFKSGLFTTAGSQSNSNVLVDVRTATSPGNLTGLGLDPTVQQVFHLLPNPPADDVIPGVAGTLQFASPDALNGYQWLGKIDHRLTNRHQLTMRYAYNHANESDPFHTEFAPGIDVLASPSYAHGVFAGLTSTVSTQMVNDFKFGWNKVFAGFQSNCGGIFAPITGVDSAGFGRDLSVPEGALGVPPLFVFGCNTLFNATGQLRHTGTTSYGDTLTWVKGNHTIKFGGDFRDVNSSGFDNFFSRDNLSFNRFQQFGQPAVNGVPSVTQDLIWMLVGGTTSQVQAQFFNKSGARQTSDDKKFIQHEYDAFVQDSWKVRRNLTLSFGLRYQFDGVPFETGGNFSNLFQNADSFASALTFTVVGPGNAKHDMYANDYTNFEPRIGLAWDPGGDGKTAVRAAYGIFHDRIFDNLFGNARGNPPFQGAVVNLFQGTTPTPENVPFAEAAPPALTYHNGDYALATLLANNIRMPESQSWNFGIQREVAQGLVLDVTYVGNHSLRIIRGLDAAPPDPALVEQAIAACVQNDPGLCQAGDPAGVVSGSNLYTGVFDPVTGAQVAPPSVRQTAVQVLSGIPNSITMTNAQSNYNALQVKLSRAYAHGLAFAVAYTWSHAIDNSNDPLNTVESGFGSFPLDSRNADTQMRGNSDNDLRHRMTANFSYELPFGRGQAYLSGGILGKVLEGFQVTGIVTLQTGHPYMVIVPGVDTARTGSTLSVNGSWPNVVGDPYAHSGSRITPSGVVTGASNQEAFAQADYGFQGDAGRNNFYGPHYYETNTALLKNMRISERVRAQFRAEVFNLFNRPQFSQPANFVGFGNLGLSTSTITRSDGTTSNRQIQLALKLSF